MTIFGHRKGSGKYRMKTEYRGGYRNPPGVNGPHGPKVEERRGGQGRPHAPSPSSTNWTRRGGGAPPFSYSPSTSPNPTRKREGVLLPVGVGLLLARLLLAGSPSPLILYIRGQGGTSRDTTWSVRSFLSRVRCPPPPYSTSVILLQRLG